MIDETLCVVSAIAAVLVDRSFLAPRLDDSASAGPSANPSRLLPMLGVPLLMTAGAIVTGLLSAFVFSPLHAAYLAPPAFAATVIACALSGGMRSSGTPAARRNRALNRAAVIALLLGLPSLPFYREGAAVSFAVFVLAGVAIGLGYAVMVIFYDGIREKIAGGGRTGARPPLSRELCIAGLLALVFIGILKTFH
jgi:Na+-translocating ferredoxin:NAD+ oxidoreductase RnfA subunit